MKNVKELIEYLEQIEDKENTGVQLEGCDCYGDWNGQAELYEDEDSLYEKILLLNTERD